MTPQDPPMERNAIMDADLTLDCFARAIAWEEYLDRNPGKKEELLGIHRALILEKRFLDYLRTKGPLRILAVGSAWCQDVVHQFPLLRRLEESLEGCQVRFLESEPDKSDLHRLAREGAETIPLILFLGPDYRELGRTSGRKLLAKEWMKSAVAGRRIADIPIDEVRRTVAEFNLRFCREFAHEVCAAVEICLIGGFQPVEVAPGPGLGCALPERAVGKGNSDG